MEQIIIITTEYGARWPTPDETLPPTLRKVDIWEKYGDYFVSKW